MPDTSSTLCFRWEFLLPLLSALYAIVNEKKNELKVAIQVFE